MIKSISISNFQSHKDSTLEFSDGVNAIIGPSDSGKTAILRALRWLVWNRPLGDEFRSNWGGDTRVGCTLDQLGSTYLLRIKTKQHNRYLIQEELGETELQFDAIKADVPEEIQNMLNINEINLQQQLDQPFLLADSPGEVGAHFNRIAHLDTIDIGNQNIQKWIRSLEQDIRSGEQHLKELKEELGKYEHLDKFEQEVQLLETLDKQQESLYQKISKLKRLISDLTDTQEEINKKEPLLSIEPQIKELLKLYDEKRERQKEQDKLKNFVTIYEATTKKYRDKRRYLLEIEKKFHDVFPAVCPLCGQEVKDERNN